MYLTGVIEIEGTPKKVLPYVKAGGPPTKEGLLLNSVVCYLCGFVHVVFDLLFSSAAFWIKSIALFCPAFDLAWVRTSPAVLQAALSMKESGQVFFFEDVFFS